MKAPMSLFPLPTHLPPFRRSRGEEWGRRKGTFLLLPSVANATGEQAVWRPRLGGLRGRVSFERRAQGCIRKREGGEGASVVQYF